MEVTTHIQHRPPNYESEEERETVRLHTAEEGKGESGGGDRWRRGMYGEGGEGHGKTDGIYVCTYAMRTAGGGICKYVRHVRHAYGGRGYM